MTGGVHLHTLSCPTPEAFRRIEAALDAKGLLYKKKNKEPAFIVKNPRGLVHRRKTKTVG